MAKRVNKRFLVALTAVVLIGGVAAMVAAYVLPRMFKKNPQELVAESKRLEAEYEESVRQGKPDRAKGEAAVNKYRDAAGSDQKDAKLRLGLGDMFYRHMILDPQQYPSLARRSWEDALVLEPRNTEALTRLLDMAWAIAETHPRREAFTAVQDAANRLLAVDPGNAEAQARKHIATVRQAQLNPLARADEVEESVKALRELWAKDPANASLPLWASQGEVYLASQALKRGVTGRAEARRRVDALEQSLPGMLKGQEANPEMQFYAAQMYRQMPALDAAMRSGPTTNPVNSPAGKYTDRVTAAYAAARQHVKPPKAGVTPRERDLFYDVQLANVQWLAQLGKADESRALLDELAAAHGDEPRVRLAYATQFRQDPGRRAKIIDMLARPVPAEGYTGIDALNLKQRETALRFEAATLRLATLDPADPAARKKVIDAVEAEVRQLEQTVSPTAVPMLELRGRLHLVQGRLADAIPLLQQAVDARGETRDVDTLQVMLQLAEAYSRQGLTGQAEKLLAEMVNKFPGYLPARVMRAQALIQDGRKAEARQQIAELKKLSPKAPEIAALEASVEGGEKLSALVEQMPETTSAERLRKATNLRAEGKLDEAIALAEQTVKEEPKNLQAVQLLVDLYLRAERRDDAVAAVNEAIKANPENEQLKKWPDALVKRSPEEYEQWALEQIKQDPDVASREVKLYQYHMARAATAAQRGDEEGRKRESAEAEAHLAAAERTKPDDKGLPVRRFEFLVNQQRFEEADKLLRRLAADNADQVQGHLFRFQLAIARARAAGGNAAAQAAAYTEAEAAALEMTKLRPQFDAGWQCLGAVMQARGRHRDAAQYFNNALERRGRNYEALRGLAEAHYALGDPAAAKAVLVRARESFPRDAALRELLLAHEVNHGGDLAKVAAEREQILKEQPNNAANAAALAHTYERLAVTSGADKARQKEMTGKLRALLEDGRKRWPDDARFVLPLAQAVLRDGDFLGGEKLVKEFAAQPAVADKPVADLLLAEYYAAANKPAMAEQSLRDALAKSNGAPDIKHDLARLLAATNRPAEAVRELRGVPGVAAARLRVQSLFAAGKPQEADQALTDALAADPGNVELSNFQIEVLLNTNRVAEAEPVVQQRVARSDADDQARYYRALVKLRKQPGDVPGAVKDLTDLAERNPRSLQVLTLLADTRAASNDLPGAIDDLERALRLAPLSRDLRLKMIEWSGSAGRWDAVRKLATESAAHPELGKDPAWNRALAKAYAATGNFAEAEKAIGRAIAMVPAERAADLQREQLAVLHQAKNYARVLQLTGDMLAKGRKEWWVYQFRGMAKAGAKDKTAAQEFDAALASVDPEKQFPAAQAVIRTIATTAGVEEALKRVAKWEEANPRWRLVAADLCAGKGDFAAALTHLQPLQAEAEKLPPDVRAPFYRALAQAYHQTRPNPAYEKAVDAYERYLKLQPGDVEGLNNLAYILAEEIAPARPQDAKQYSKVAYEIARGWRASDAKGRIFDTHGWVLVLNGGSDLDEGIRVLRQAVDGFPILEAHYHLGEAELRKKRGSEATEQFNAALAMIEKSKKSKQPYDESLEPRIRRGLQDAKALDAAAAAGGR